jgi:hypothetical protein
MRPTYETDANLRSEIAVKEILEKNWNCELTKLPTQYRFDYVAERNGKVVAFIEIKVRKYSYNRIDEMGGYMISLSKIVAAKQFAMAAGIRSILAVSMFEGVYYFPIDKQFVTSDLAIKGRTDRGDWEDVEPCVLIPMNEFFKL